MSIEAADILRKLALGQASVILVMAVWTIVRYARNIRTAPSNNKALPAHVALVATSYLVFLLYVCADLYEKFGRPSTWSIPLALTGCLLGCGALAFLVAHLSVRRFLQVRIDREADKAMDTALKRKAEVQERRMDRMEEVGQQTHDALQGIQHDTLQRIEESVGVAAEKADHAYHEANQVNTKIADMREQHLGRTEDVSKIENIIKALEQINEEARVAKDTAKEVSDKADVIDEVGSDTNVRVRKMEQSQGIKPNKI